MLPPPSSRRAPPPQPLWSGSTSVGNDVLAGDERESQVHTVVIRIFEAPDPALAMLRYSAASRPRLRRCSRNSLRVHFLAAARSRSRSTSWSSPGMRSGRAGELTSRAAYIALFQEIVASW